MGHKVKGDTHRVDISQVWQMACSQSAKLSVCFIVTVPIETPLNELDHFVSTCWCADLMNFNLIVVSQIYLKTTLDFIESYRSSKSLEMLTYLTAYFGFFLTMCKSRKSKWRSTLIVGHIMSLTNGLIALRIAECLLSCSFPHWNPTEQTGLHLLMCWPCECHLCDSVSNKPCYNFSFYCERLK